MKNALPHPKSDTQQTLLALIRNRSLTSIELRRITKSSYPAARCFDLKKLGLSIYSTMEPYINRRGRKSSVARYHLGSTLKEAVKIYKKMVA